jgi:hypothetical protein
VSLQLFSLVERRLHSEGQRAVGHGDRSRSASCCGGHRNVLVERERLPEAAAMPAPDSSKKVLHGTNPAKNSE